MSRSVSIAVLTAALVFGAGILAPLRMNLSATASAESGNHRRKD